MRNLILHIILILTLFSCEEEINWDTNTYQVNEIIVDCILTNEYKQQKLNISFLSDNLNEKPIAVTGAIVSISTDTKTYIMVENPYESGVYISDSMQAVIGKTYYLSILYNNKKYFSQTYMVPISHFNPLNYSSVNDSMYQIEAYISPVAGQNPAMWKVYLDWSQVSGYNLLPLEKTTAELVYYSLPSVDASQIFSPKKEKIYFPIGTKITEKKYSLTPEYAEFLRTLLAETEWRGGYFDTQPANVITNLSEGAYGYFAASTVYSIELIAK